MALFEFIFTLAFVAVVSLSLMAVWELLVPRGATVSLRARRLEKANARTH